MELLDKTIIPVGGGGASTSKAMVAPFSAVQIKKVSKRKLGEVRHGGRNP